MKIRKTLSKKVNVFGKGIPVFAFVILGLALVSAALIPYWGVITGLVTVNQGLTVDGGNWDTVITEPAVTMTSLDAKMISSGHYLDNQADVDATVYLKTTCVGGGDSCVSVPISTDTIGLSTKWSTKADAFADASMAGGVVTLIADKFSDVDWSSSEARIVILGKDVGITTLDELLTMSWNVDVVTGYIAHVDVILDTDGDGDSDDALVFEAAKVDPTNCELATAYPTGTQNTLGRVSIIDSTSYAWLSSGASGPLCVLIDNGGSTGFYTYSLSQWIAGPNAAYVNSISGNTIVLRFEIEVDGWDQTHDGAVAESHISNIMINTIPVEIATLPTPVVVEGNSGLAFYVNSEFPKMLVPGTYNITTIVDDTA